jgi:hypothetical protein
MEEPVVVVIVVMVLVEVSVAVVVLLLPVAGVAGTPVVVAVVHHQIVTPVAVAVGHISIHREPV